MKSFIFSIILISILAVVLSPFYCSNNNTQLINTESPIQADTIKYINDDNPFPCCNNNNPSTTLICGNPYNPNALVNLLCNGVEYTITCQCCKALWDIYGADPEGRLNYNGPPCPGEQFFQCNALPNEQEPY